jgi:hypothetical protein
MPILNQEIIEKIIFEIASKHGLEKFQEEMDLDSSYTIE